MTLLLVFVYRKFPLACEEEGIFGWTGILSFVSEARAWRTLRELFIPIIF